MCVTCLCLIFSQSPHQMYSSRMCFGFTQLPCHLYCWCRSYWTRQCAQSPSLCEWTTFLLKPLLLSCTYHLIGLPTKLWRTLHALIFRKWLQQTHWLRPGRPESAECVRLGAGFYLSLGARRNTWCDGCCTIILVGSAPVGCTISPSCAG